MKRSPIRKVGKRRKKRFNEGYSEARVRCLERRECERCRRERDLTPHHRLPTSRGGKDILSNLVCLCIWCHGHVHAHTVDDWRDWIETKK